MTITLRIQMITLIFLVMFGVEVEAATPEGIGQIVAIQGKATIHRANQAGIVAQLKTPLYQMDRIVTGPDGKLQIMFQDETVLSQGPDSEITIDEYVYSPKERDAGSCRLSMAKGIFRTITGRITEMNPERFNVKTRMATIGIRGCDTGYRIQPQNEQILSLWLPPGHSLQITPDSPAPNDAQPPTTILQGGFMVTVDPAGGMDQRPVDNGDVQGLVNDTTPQVGTDGEVNPPGGAPGSTGGGGGGEPGDGAGENAGGAAGGGAGGTTGGADGGGTEGEPGGNTGGMPGAQPGGGPGGMPPGAQPGGEPDGLPGGMPGAQPGSELGGMPGGMPGGEAGGEPGGPLFDPMIFGGFSADDGAMPGTMPMDGLGYTPMGDPAMMGDSGMMDPLGAIQITSDMSAGFIQGPVGDPIMMDDSGMMDPLEAIQFTSDLLAWFIQEPDPLIDPNLDPLFDPDPEFVPPPLPPPEPPPEGAPGPTSTYYQQGSGVNWEWGYWEDDLGNIVESDSINYQILGGPPLDNIINQTSDTYILSGTGPAGAIINQNGTQLLPPMFGQVNFDMSVGNGNNQWSAGFNMTGGGNSLIFTVMGDFLGSAGVQLSSVSFYELTIGATPAYTTPDLLELWGSLVGPGLPAFQPVTGVVGWFDIQQGTIFVAGEYGANLTQTSPTLP